MKKRVVLILVAVMMGIGAMGQKTKYEVRNGVGIIPEGTNVIEKGAFKGREDLMSIEIPSSITRIEEEAFKGCSGLKNIHIPASVAIIDEETFTYCGGLEKITVSPDNKFYDSREDCNAIIAKVVDILIVGRKNTTIPESVIGIGDYAFAGCTDLTSIYIPASISIIGVLAWADCNRLEKITVSPKNRMFDSREGCNAIIEKRTNKLLYGCKNTTIPSSVTSLDERAGTCGSGAVTGG